MNYNPYYLDNADLTRLTARQKLAHVRKALEIIQNTRRYWPLSKWDELCDDLERQEALFANEVQRAVEAMSNEFLKDPRFVFENMSCRICRPTPPTLWFYPRAYNRRLPA